jgi:hypothetical protein
MESEALTFYRYKCVFPKKGSPEWPALETLVRYNISIKAVDLIHLIDVRMLNLLHLRIGEIRLLEGTWEGVFECLKGSDPLLSIRFDRKTEIYHRYGEILWDPHSVRKLYDNVENFILDIGCHPCLMEEQCYFEAQEFVDDMQRFPDTEIA